MSRFARITPSLKKVVVGSPVVATGAFIAHELVQDRRFVVNKIQTLDPDSNKRVVVLGAGIVGTATAYFLTLKGLQVTVLEAAPDAGQRTSNASGCQLSVINNKPTVNPGYPRKIIGALIGGEPWLKIQPWAIFDFELIRWGVRILGVCYSPSTLQRCEEFLTRNSPYMVKLVSEIAKAEGFEGQYCASHNGMLTVHGTEAAFESARKNVHPGATALPKAEAFQREPCLEASPTPVAGAVFAPMDEQGDCGIFSSLLAKACEKRGATFRYSTHVESLRTSSEAGATKVVAAVLSDGQEVKGDMFVVAMGSQTPRLLRPLGIDLPIYPVKGYSYEIDCSTHGLKSPIAVTDHQIAAIPIGDKRLRFSSIAEFAGWDECAASPAVALKFKQDIEWLFPSLVGNGALDNAKLIVGGRPTTPDDLPIVSGTRVPNLMVNAGHCMRGWRTACGTAAILAALATDSPIPNGMDADALSLSRFALTPQLTLGGWLPLPQLSLQGN